MRTAVALLTAAALAGPLAGQAPPPSEGTLLSQQAALRILSRGLEAHGGYARLNAPGYTRTRYSIVQYMPGQEVRPGDTEPVPIVVAAGPNSRSAQFFTVTTDAIQRTLVIEVFTSDTATRPTQRAVRTPTDRFALRVASNTVQEIPDAILNRQLRSSTPFLPATLLGAWNARATLRLMGRQTVAGQACDAITFADTTGTQTTLCFDVRTGLLDATEVLVQNEPFGLVAQRMTYSGYRTDGGLTMPSAAQTAVRGRPAGRIAILQVEANVELDTALLRRPEGANRLPAPLAGGGPAAPRGIAVNQIAPGVFVLQNVTNGYHEMFVDMGDHVIVIEADGNPGVSESVLRTVAEQLPGKPVRGVVLTHHHDDHSGGLWTYLARGIPVYTTAGNVAFVRSIATLPRAEDGRLAPAPQPRIEVVSRRRTLGSGPNAIQLIDVGPNPHAAEILVAYLPGHKLLYVPDIYGYMPGFQPPEMLVSFADALARLNLDIETFVTAHTDPTTRAQYDEWVTRARAGQSRMPGAGGR